LSDVIIVLTRPAEAGNVGAVCRAMQNMGLYRLRLVKPEFNELAPDEASLSETGFSYGGSREVIRARAVHASEIWEKAESFDSLAEAIKDCALVIGTTCRRGRKRKQLSMTPSELAHFLKKHPGPAALVFGTERTGLEEEEIQLCNLASHIPADKKFPSLNLSHALQVYAYELFKSLAEPELEAVKGQWVPIKQEVIEALVADVTDNLGMLGFYKQAGREEQRRFFRDVFSRAAITEKEGQYFSRLITRAVRLALKA